MTNVDIGLLEIAADLAVQRALSATIVPIIQHGVVVDIDLNLYIHDVQMDGDTETIMVHDVTEFGVTVGQRVTVLFAPPHQAMIVGTPIHDTWHQVGTLGNAAFISGWDNHSLSGPLDSLEFPEAMYRHFGHWVEVRGGVVRTSGASNTFFVLPVGYRPRNNLTLQAMNSLTGFETLQVNQDGGVTHPAGGTGPFFFSVSFSVS